ncbi:hypothetical protein JKI95_02100 [Corynebacterium aquatimens]|uniref:hypothetical protein n=1 Tax=Corynebacterium aquatimens TaxID=1190508 RepID=UPI002540FC3B|nr:hypothetical protein [Corynebacterium aquatimens]QYH19908.1 hypothetical protein JKI95_02100 [Corynebacterium aquatimens]
MTISENATGGEFEPDMNTSENQDNPQDVAAAEAAAEDTRDAGFLRRPALRRNSRPLPKLKRTRF